jgi:hypothetical protein
MHAKFDNFMKTNFPGVKFKFNTAPGLTGPDAIVLKGAPGFVRAELKPFSESGWRTFLAQEDKWGTTKIFAYDAKGNIFAWPTK